jgi:uncharacterized protein
MSRQISFFIAIGILALLHFYIGWRLLPGLAWAAVWRYGAIAFLFASCVLIPLGLVARGIKRPRLSDMLAWVGLLAMGFFSSLFITTLLRDVLLFFGSMLESIFPLLGSPMLVTYSAIAAPALAVLMTVVGYINARRVARVVDVMLPVKDLAEALHGFTIVQISDVHVGQTIKRRYVQRIVDTVNTLNADLIAITGDLVDGSVSDLAHHTAPLTELRANHGRFFVTGNHEYYSGAAEWIGELRKLGLSVLLNEHVVINHNNAQLTVAGVTDFTAGAFDSQHRSDPHKAIAGAPSASVKLLLAHQPRSATEAAKAGFDIQLSGHTHGGQFWPWNYFVPLQQPFTAGLHRLEQLRIYVSRGTGYWGPPKRFGAASEITRLRLVRSD